MAAASVSVLPRVRNSVNCCSRCCASSSTRSASCAGVTFAAARRLRTSARQSGIARPGDVGDGFDELLPALPLHRENLPSLARDRVIPSPPLLGPLDPSSDNPAALLHAIEHRIER